MRSRLVALPLLLAAFAAQVPVAQAADRAARASTTPLARPSGDGDACRRLPEGKRLKLNLKPNTDLVDLVSWISAITCKQFIVPGTIPPQSRTVTIIAPRPITVAEAYDLFLDALEAVGLTVYSSGGALRVIEAAKARFSPIPVKIDDQE
jgi:type II secretory pathway component GspD/PulD (secretin)